VFRLGLGKFKTGRPRCAPRRRAATPHPRARTLGVRGRAPPDAPPPEVALRPRPRAFPRHRVPRSGNPQPRACHGPRRTGRCVPQTAGPSEAHRCTCAGRDGRATVVSPASRRSHRKSSAIKARASSALARPTNPPAANAAATVC
jgi:hypothetical protein